MEHMPSLFDLCQKQLASLIAYDKCYWNCLDVLPLDIVGGVLKNLPPLTLQALQEQMLTSSSNCISMARNAAKPRKRARAPEYQDLSCKRASILRSNESLKQVNDQPGLVEHKMKMNLQSCFNDAWKDMFSIRWPEGVKQTGFLASFTEDNTSTKCEHGINGKVVRDQKDWQQSYWEAHLQDCLREAAAQALIPSYEGSIGEIFLSDIILEHIRYKPDCTYMNNDLLKVKYHCQQFGHYARNLRLQNVLCVEELCDLLRSSRLQGLVFHGISSKSHVEGACRILNQNKETLEAVEFIYCRLSSTGLDEICASLNDEGRSIHRIQYFAMMSCRALFNEDNVYLSGFLQFLSSGRFLHSLKLCDNGLNPKMAATIFYFLFESGSHLSILELCDNKLSGWLSGQFERVPYSDSLPPKDPSFLRSLTVLNLRANFLESQDIERLKGFLQLMPQLQKLDLSDNPIGDSGIRFIHRSLISYFQGISATNPFLVDVKIANCNISCIGASLLFDSLSSLNKPLHSLSVAHNELGSSIATPLANFLKKTHIEWLDIECIGLGPSGCYQIQEAICCSQGLVRFNMSKNRGGSAAAIVLSKLLLHAEKISFIDASYNFLCLESLKLIATSLKKSKGQIKRLDLRGGGDAYHAKILGIFDEFYFDGQPIVILPPSLPVNAAIDDDP